jgi:AcrR family transcriptional regulator
LGVVSTGTDVLSVSDRDRILQAMAECCADAGYRETTVEAVMERAGIQPASFESHFAGKEDCALAALNKIVSEALAQISMANSNVAGLVEQRKLEVRALLELLAARPSFSRLAFIDARQGGSARMHDAYESAVRVLALMMERANGGSGQPSTGARAALGGAEAVVRKEVAAGRAERLPQLLPDFVYAALVPFVGQGEALRQAKLAASLAAEEGWR